MTTDVGQNGAADRVTIDVDSLPAYQQRRRQRIIEVALRLLLEDDRNLEIRDVVDAAKVSLSTLYRYFGSKEVLLSECYIFWRKREYHRVAEAARDKRSDSTRTRAAVQTFVTLYEEAPRMWDISVATRSSTLPEIVAIRRGMDDGTWDQYRNIIKDMPSDDAKGIVSILISVFAYAMSRWRVGDWSLKEVRAEIDRAVTLTLDVRAGEGRPRDEVDGK